MNGDRNVDLSLTEPFQTEASPTDSADILGGLLLAFGFDRSVANLFPGSAAS